MWGGSGRGLGCHVWNGIRIWNPGSFPVVQWLRSMLYWKGHRFDPWLGNKDPTSQAMRSTKQSKKKTTAKKEKPLKISPNLKSKEQCWWPMSVLVGLSPTVPSSFQRGNWGWEKKSPVHSQVIRHVEPQIAALNRADSSCCTKTRRFSLLRTQDWFELGQGRAGLLYLWLVLFCSPHASSSALGLTVS